MNRIGVLLLCLSFAAHAGSLLPTPSKGQQWQPVELLSDEFEGDRLDARKWLPFLPYYVGRPPSRFERDNVAVRDGHLQLRATAALDYLPGVQDWEKDIWVYTACVASLRPIASYGYYEARLKASRLSVTSSFWLQGKNSEIDVVEHIGASTKRPRQAQVMRSALHYGFQESWKNDRQVVTTWQMPGSSADDFHVYGVWWKDADTVWFYFDGEKVSELKPPGPFLEPMYLFFDAEVFKGEGLPTVESLQDPARNVMRVDWVRAWQLRPD